MKEKNQISNLQKQYTQNNNNRLRKSEVDMTLASFTRRPTETKHAKTSNSNVAKIIHFPKPKQKKHRYINPKKIAIIALASMLGITATFAIGNSIRNSSSVQQQELVSEKETLLAEAQDALLDVIFADSLNDRENSRIEIHSYQTEDEMTAVFDVITKYNMQINQRTEATTMQLFCNSQTKYPQELSDLLNAMLTVNTTDKVKQKDLDMLTAATAAFEEADYSCYKNELDYTDKIQEKIKEDKAKEFKPFTTLLPNNSKDDNER